MARRNADCRWRCVVFQRGRLRPARRIRIYGNGRVMVRMGRQRERDKYHRKEMANFERDLSPSPRLSACPFSFLRPRLRGKEGFLPLSMPASAFVRIRIYVRGFELCSFGWREGREGDGEREVDRESTEEVEERLASIRERDADRVGESWVRSHKEVDTRRHLNPPRPPARPLPRATSSPPASPLGLLSAPHAAFLPRTSDRPPSPSPTHPSLHFALSRSVCLAPSISSSSFSLSPALRCYSLSAF